METDNNKRNPESAFSLWLFWGFYLISLLALSHPNVLTLQVTKDTYTHTRTDKEKHKQSISINTEDQFDKN